MARLKDLQSNWTSGELDQDLLGQMELKHYYSGAEKMRNVLVSPLGGFRQRPGLAYVDEALPELSLIDLSGPGIVVTMPNGGDPALLYDGDKSTKTNTTTPLEDIDPYVVVHVDFGTPTQIYFFDVYQWQFSNPSEFPNEMVLQVSTDNVNWIIAGERFLQTSNSQERDRRRLVDGSYRYARFARIDSATSFPAGSIVLTQVQFWQRSATLSPVVLVPHNFSTFERYVMAFTDRNMRVYRNKVRVADVPSPYPSAALYTETELGIQQINWTSLDDTLLTFCEGCIPQRFQRQGSDAEWDVRDWVLNNIPQYDFGDGPEDVISDARGWPRCGTFFQGRLWMAGSRSRPQTLWASRSGDFEDFDTSLTDDDYGIDVTADVDDVAAFFQLYVGRHLQLFASSAEFYVPISELEGVTPKNIILRRTTQIGVKRGIRVYDVDGATVFLSTTGRMLREFLFTDTEQAYQALPISKLASHLVRNPVAVSYRKALGMENPDYVWMCNSDGTLAAFCTLRDENVNAMTLSETAGKFLHTVVSRDESYFAVERTINGVQRRFIEIFDEGLHVDAGLRGTGQVSGASGLDHLEGETVQIILDDLPAGEAVVSGGAVTFERETRESWEVGLKWPYVDPEQKYIAYAQSVPIEGALPDGTQLGMRKRVVTVSVRLEETRALKVNGKSVRFRKWGSELLDQTPEPFTGDKVVRGILGNAYRAQVEMGIDQPGDFKVLATSYKVAV